MEEPKHCDISINLICDNRGQIEGVPANPRLIKDEMFQKLKDSINENPEMLKLRPLLVYELNGKYISIGGNQRYAALKDLGWDKVPCVVIPAEATAEQIKAYIIKDNAGFGEWDFSMLSQDWDVQDLSDWGIDTSYLTPLEEVGNIDDLFEAADDFQQKEKEIKIEVIIPKEQEGSIEDIRAAIRLTTEEWKGITVR